MLRPPAFLVNPRYAMGLFNLLPKSTHIAAGSAAAWLGGVHLLVDAATVSAILRAAPPSYAQVSSAFAFVLAYDVLAFAGQLPLGALLDKWGCRRMAAVLGVILAMGAVLAVREGSLPTLILAGVGNALFHVGAGAMVLDGSEGKAAPAGVFVAPGALGLGLGLALGRTFVSVPLWPFHVVLGAAAILCWLVPSTVVREPACVVAQRSPAALLGPTQSALIVVLLFVSVFVRSFIGTVACDECPKGIFLLCAVPIAGFIGKLSGGYLADRMGFADLAMIALLSSAPLLGFSGGSLPMALVGLVLFQMTMPVTLVALYRLLPHRPATGFGLLCVALVLGVATAQWPGMVRPSGVAVCVLILASAVALYAALQRLSKIPAHAAPLVPASSSTLREVH